MTSCYEDVPQERPPPPPPDAPSAPTIHSDRPHKLGWSIPSDCYIDVDATPVLGNAGQNLDNRPGFFEALKNTLTSWAPESSNTSGLSSAEEFEEFCSKQVHTIDAWSSGLMTGEVEADNLDRRIWQYVARRGGSMETLALAKAHVEANPECTHDRGPLGSLPVHMCFLINSSFHKLLGMFMITFDERLRASRARRSRAHLPRLIEVPYFSDENPDDDVFHGQNLLHTALVHRDTELVQWLVRLCPRLIMGYCSGPFYGPNGPCYFGSTPFHFAAATGQEDMVRLILEIARQHTNLHDKPVQPRRGSVLGAPRAIDGQASRMMGSTQSDPLASAGYLQSFAAERAQAVGYQPLCTMSPDLRGPVQRQRFLDQPDFWGNNVLHMLVVCSGRGIDDPEAEEEEGGAPADPMSEPDDLWLVRMYNVCVKLEEDIRQECKDKYGKLHSHRLGDTLNHDGYTPLVFAAKAGNLVMFRHILNSTSILNWMYGPIVCKSYALDGFDAPPSVHKDAPYALQVVVQQGASARHVRFFKDPVVLRVVNRNWNAYAKKRFYSRLFVTLAFGTMLILTALASARADPNANEDYDKDKMVVPMKIFSYFGRIMCIIAAFFQAKKEISVIQNDGLPAYLEETGAAFLENLMSWTFVTLVSLSSIAMVLPASYNWLDAIAMSGLCVTVCGYLFFFFLGFELTGGYIVMIGQMVVTDMARFSSAFLTLVLGYATAFHLLFRASSMQSFALLVRDVFLMAVGQVDPAQFVDCHAPPFCTFMMCTFIVIVNVLLLNLLIATMGETYGRMQRYAIQTWMMERCRITLSIKSESPEDVVEKFWVDQHVEDLLALMDEENPHDESGAPTPARMGQMGFGEAEVSEMDEETAEVSIPKKEQEHLQRFLVALEPVPEYNVREMDDEAQGGKEDGPKGDGGGDEGGSAGEDDDRAREEMPSVQQADRLMAERGVSGDRATGYDRLPGGVGGSAADRGDTMTRLAADSSRTAWE
eukprot:TRINITY_DN2257_c0_g1_i1.p1 TRINITY_DN2257_c0_g1~~TRINITY_DN2257_c0_g1_i1.p1  ORF type:complete len:989 (+),score=244.32 TRINITY_DN2257_c0_g1_i1:139-3105(+)